MATKTYPKVVQCDERGQLVIPKEIREALSLGAGSAFWVCQEDENIVLKPIDQPENGRKAKK